MLGGSGVAAQSLASRIVLSSIQLELVIKLLFYKLLVRANLIHWTCRYNTVGVSLPSS
jgi:hypothetical protein